MYIVHTVSIGVKIDKVGKAIGVDVIIALHKIRDRVIV